MHALFREYEGLSITTGKRDIKGKKEKIMWSWKAELEFLTGSNKKNRGFSKKYCWKDLNLPMPWSSNKNEKSSTCCKVSRSSCLGRSKKERNCFSISRHLTPTTEVWSRAINAVTLKSRHIIYLRAQSAMKNRSVWFSDVHAKYFSLSRHSRWAQRSHLASNSCPIHKSI